MAIDDPYKMKGMRSRLVTLLRNKGIQDESVLKAIANVPRHLFLDRAFWDWAYKDQAFPIAAEQTISQPYTVAFQTQLLEPKSDDIIFEVGTGSGYQASVLSLLCKRVYTIERHQVLFRNATELINRLSYLNIRTYFGDGYAGLPSRAPFDKIIVTAGATSIPKGLLLQLKVGGYMVIPVGQGEDQEMLRIIKTSENQFHQERHGVFRFVPFLNGSSASKDANDQTHRVSL